MRRYPARPSRFQVYSQPTPGISTSCIRDEREVGRRASERTLLPGSIEASWKRCSTRGGDRTKSCLSDESTTRRSFLISSILYPRSIGSKNVFAEGEHLEPRRLRRLKRRT